MSYQQITEATVSSINGNGENVAKLIGITADQYVSKFVANAEKTTDNADAIFNDFIKTVANKRFSKLKLDEVYRFEFKNGASFIVLIKEV